MDFDKKTATFTTTADKDAARAACQKAFADTSYGIVSFEELAAGDS